MCGGLALGVDHRRAERRLEQARGARGVAALRDERVVAAHDELLDPRTRELAAGYFSLYGVSSTLDAPVFVRGRLVGVYQPHVYERTRHLHRELGIDEETAERLIERMEREGLISAANATGKREILVPGDSARD